MPLVVDDGLGLIGDDRLYEFILVGKVVVQLRPTDLCRRLDVVEGRAGHTALVDQARCLLHDAGPGAFTLCGKPRPIARLVDHAPRVATLWV